MVRFLTTALSAAKPACVLNGFRLRLLLAPAESDHSDKSGERRAAFEMMLNTRRTTETTLTLAARPNGASTENPDEQYGKATDRPVLWR